MRAEAERSDAWESASVRNRLTRRFEQKCKFALNLLRTCTLRTFERICGDAPYLRCDVRRAVTGYERRIRNRHLSPASRSNIRRRIPPLSIRFFRRFVSTFRPFLSAVAGKCRNRTYQPPCEGLSGFEDRAGHQTRTLPRRTASPSVPQSKRPVPDQGPRSTISNIMASLRPSSER